ncbi:hypothetical protein BT96DRAFT_840339 [Gymnopus androsaceus JB14]|uniref:Uncharacterized protein n=1 Tax=Gymnopus androsaceus JB14 TaxID=1447944 RepID=A0A6A4GJZ3_9AGAR|nr:hypothetical protein BT96DRAFT_840339 [Gymnopus androsaceus JB14]
MCIMTLRPYLYIIMVPKHCHAFTHFIASAHALSVEHLCPHIPHDWRLCCFCHSGIEDECHALLMCNGSCTLVYLCCCFLEDLFDKVPSLRTSYLSISSLDFL